MMTAVIGAIIGDVVGSRFERHNHKSKKFELFTTKNKFTDDTVMTLAVADAIMDMVAQGLVLGRDDLAIQNLVITAMQKLGKAYPLAGYGLKFSRWLRSNNPKPYGSYGNGAAMRISPVADLPLSSQDQDYLAGLITAVSHDAEEGLLGASAMVTAITTGKYQQDKALIAGKMANAYPLDFTLEDIRPTYQFDVSCAGSIPVVFQAFLESKDFEDAIRNAISVGGDSDTIASMAGAIASAHYQSIPDDIVIKTLTYLPEDLRTIFIKWQSFIG
ncbi:ADP-ribosylglycohydrolase family protein [Aerococcaceae bacterium 50-4]